MYPLDHDSGTRLLRLARTRGSGIPGREEQLLQDLEHLATRVQPEFEILLPLILAGAKRHGLAQRFEKESRYALEARSTRQISLVDRQQKWLEWVLPKIDEAGLRVILLKGAAFRGTIYSDIPRSSADLDVLVRRSDWIKFCSFVKENTSHVSEQPGRRVSQLADYEAGFLANDGRGTFVVEVHRGLTNPLIFSIDENAIWSRAVPHPGYDQGDPLVLSCEDNLLHLAVHRYKHLGSSVQNILDAHEIIAKDSLDWESLVARAREWGAMRALYFLLKAASSILETPVPQSVLLQLEPPALAAIAGDLFFEMGARWDLKQGQASYRLAQLFGQLCIPDSKIRMLAFQGYYTGLRVLDMAFELMTTGSRTK